MKRPATIMMRQLVCIMMPIRNIITTVKRLAIYTGIQRNVPTSKRRKRIARQVAKPQLVPSQVFNRNRL